MQAMNLYTSTLAALVLSFSTNLSAQEYSPAVGENFPRQVYFGDLHLHSRASADAYTMGNVTLTPGDAYRFAKGEELTSSSGLPAKLRRPLDFLAVTDHAEFMGVLNAFREKNPVLMASPIGKRWGALSEDGFFDAFVTALSDPDPVRDDIPDALEHSIWQEITQAADTHYQPGNFTTFLAYEWTSASEGNNLHRCVIYREDSETVSAHLPFSSFVSSDPEELWAAMQKYEETSGGRVMSIPHNGNLSNGIMWDTLTLSGKPIDADYARKRMRWEPIAEVTQIKGDSETHPLLSPNDKFADFERWDRYNIMNTAKTTPEMLPGSYARSALQRGLKFQNSLGANPYKFGMIGSTDSHTSLSTANEDNFFGKFANSEPGVRNSETMMAGMKNADWELGASGLSAVWARENNREEIFASLERKEVYATTGPRILLRFFGGWNFGNGAIDKPDYASIAYEKGVPMGADLPSKGAENSPEFLIYALKDPDGANIDRLQVVKGWADADNKEHEKVYDVAVSEKSNDLGVAQLSAQWRDPDFDKLQQAFYYARVLEVPRPRWTAYDEQALGTTAPTAAPKAIRDRAYSSPIWYTPE
ncbi:MAG: DUF3604 domain-containing protein [Halioglobus sp.]